MRSSFHRRIPVILALVGSPGPLIWAVAAFAFTSVQDPVALEALERRLDDPSTDVRGNAALAPGQLSLPDEGIELVTPLVGESDPAVRRHLIEALGKRGGIDATSELVAGSDEADEEAERTLAVARAALREVRPPGAPDFLAERLTHPDPE